MARLAFGKKKQGPKLWGSGVGTMCPIGMVGYERTGQAYLKGNNNGETSSVLQGGNFLSIPIQKVLRTTITCAVS